MKANALMFHFDHLSPIESLEAYVTQVQKFPLLTEQEEKDFALRWREKKELNAARALVLSHLRYVVKLARAYRGYGLPEGDLIQEGNVGLMKAVQRFKPEVGVRLASFAIHWIKAEMHDFIIKNFRTIKMATTKAQRKLFFNLSKMKKNWGFLSDAEKAQIAETLNVPEKDVTLMESRFLNHDVSLEAPANAGGDEEAFYPIQYLADPQADPFTQCANEEWQHDQTQRLQEGLGSLPARERRIIEARWLMEEKMTLQELAQEFKISIERVRQLEASAFKKLRKEWVA